MTPILDIFNKYVKIFTHKGSETMLTTYKDMYDSIDDEINLVDKRLDMVRFANDNGIKVAARFYSCSKNTIKK